MRLEHDPKADAVYVYLRDGEYAYGENLDDERRIDYTSSGTPIGVELLSVSHGVNIEGLPEDEEIARRLEAENIEVYVEAHYASGTSMGKPFFICAYTDPSEPISIWQTGSVVNLSQRDRNIFIFGVPVMSQ